MKMDFNLNLTQEQKLIMTQQMQLSVKMLQMSTYELQKFVEQELQENPVLDAKYPEANKTNDVGEKNYKDLIKYLQEDKYMSRTQYFNNNTEDEISPFNFIASKQSLKEYLYEQISELKISEYKENICNYIIENIDGKGYLDNSIENIAKELRINSDIVQESLQIVQSLEPAGIAARDIKECLKIQALRRENIETEVIEIIDRFLEHMAENKYNVIATELNITPKEAQRYGDIIKSFEPKPSRGFYTGESTRYIIPDAYIRKINDEFHIVMNDDVVPKLSINNIYKEIINDEKDKDAVDYVKDKLNSALFLMKSIQNRKSTIYKVLEKIIENQEAYFKMGDEYLKPMTLKEIADSIEMHESTVSRAIRDKYIYTGNRTIKIKDLFTKGISTDSYEDVSTNIIKNTIKELVDNEEKKKPLSDQKITEILNEKGMNISRRTVAKYRESMGIRSSSKRKRF